MAKTKKKNTPAKPGHKAKKPSVSGAGKHSHKAKKTVSPAGPARTEAAAGKVAKTPRSPFSAKEKKEYRDRLMKMRDRLTGQIDFLVTDNLSRSPNDNEMDFRSEEAGTDNFERDFALNRASLNQDTIFEIDEALNRIEMNTFGVCEACEKPIEKPRISALPYSRLCLKCKATFEAGRSRYRSFDSRGLFPTAEKPGAEPGAEEE